MHLFKHKSDHPKESSAAGASSASSGGSGGIKDRLRGAAGGGQAGERKEDPLDKGVDFVQERMGEGPQTDESALEQAKDEQISDAMRKSYENTTGWKFPVPDK